MSSPARHRALPASCCHAYLSGVVRCRGLWPPSGHRVAGDAGVRDWSAWQASLILLHVANALSAKTDVYVTPIEFGLLVLFLLSGFVVLGFCEFVKSLVTRLLGRS